MHKRPKRVFPGFWGLFYAVYRVEMKVTRNGFSEFSCLFGLLSMCLGSPQYAGEVGELLV